MKQIKNQKFDIIVGIPTYNEADCVANTVQKIDRGLVKYFPNYRSLIVNVDSENNGGTSRVFLSTATKTTKMPLVSNKRLRGKGTNIFLLLKLSKKLGAKYTATIDADITTITEKWPKLLLDPVVRKEADFVVPVYTRNRYEGNTTNHFCFPLLYAWFGKRLNQPIGGDFAMNNRFVDYVLKQRKPKNSRFYGIDIFLSTHAVGANFKIEEAYLGRKIHKPSFDKIVPMFQQVAATMLFVLSQYKKQRNTSKSNAAIENKERTDSFIRKPDQAKIAYLKKHTFQSLRQLPPRNIHKYLGISLERIESIQKAQTLISEDEWARILENLSDYIIKIKHPVGDKNAAKIATILSPFFFLRVLSYFEELEQNKRQESVDALIFNQAEKLRRLLISSNKGVNSRGENSYSNQQHSSFKTKQKGGRKAMKTPYSVTLTVIPSIPLIKEGDDIGAIILRCASDAGITFEDKDVLVATSKIVSKAEGRLVSLASVKPSKKATEIARVSGKDDRIVELMMQESQILNAEPGVVETLHRLGFICTSGGVDRANTARPEEEKVSLLPLNPDESAKKISNTIARATGKRVGVVINDSLGIKYRAGSVGLAIGISGMPALLKGAADEVDLYGKKRNVNISFADEIAAAGSLLMGQSKAGLPVILARGLQYPNENGKLADLIATDQLKNDLAK